MNTGIAMSWRAERNQISIAVWGHVTLQFTSMFLEWSSNAEKKKRI